MLKDIQYYTCFENKQLTLESGERLGHITIAYNTYGQLNTEKNNAVLILHALTGDSNIAGPNGWWLNMVGPQKPIDTEKYFVICSNVLGGCKGSTGPGSINPATNKAYGLNFPVITISDMVKVQKCLIEHLEIKCLKMVIGGSMGGMQALEWAIMYPEMVASCVPIATTAQVSPQALAYDIIGRHAIMSDQSWQKGDYYDQEDQPETGLAIARMIGHITYLSNESMTIKFGRRLQERKNYGYDFKTDFQVESYLKYQGDKFVNRFDANSYLYITKAIDYFDLAQKYESLEKAFEHTRARFLVISINSDILYPSEENQKIVKTLMKLNKEVTYFELDSLYGHDAFLLENKELEQAIYYFLAGV